MMDDQEYQQKLPTGGVVCEHFEGQSCYLLHDDGESGRFYICSKPE